MRQKSAGALEQMNADVRARRIMIFDIMHPVNNLNFH